MDNRLNLEEYLHSFHSIEEKRKVFYAISEEMHRYHNNGCYIKDLSFQTISLCFTNPTNIKFLSYEKIGRYSLTDVLNLKKQNIICLAIMMISSLLDNQDHLVILNIEFIKNNFDRFENILTEDDYKYFELIFKKDEHLYYDDYIRNITQENPRPFVEKIRISENEEAFTNCLLLTINIVIILMVLSCFLLYLS